MTARRSPSVLKALALVLVLGLLGAAASLLVSRGQRSTWSASRQVMVRTWNIDALVLSGQPTLLADEDRVSAATVATSYDVMDTASRANPALGTPDELKKAVSASLQAGSNFITVTAKGSDEDQAQDRVDGVTKAFTTVATQRVMGLAQQLATSAPSQEVRQRATAVKDLQPIQVYRTDDPTETGTSAVKAAGGGLVAGLALGAVAVAVLTFLPRRRGTAADRA